MVLIRSVAWAIALVLAIMAGCVSESPQVLHIAGLHYRWHGTDTVVATFSIVNIGSEPLVDKQLLPTIRGIHHLDWFDDSPDAPQSRGSFGTRFEDDGPWPSGRHQTFSFTHSAPNAKGREFSLYVQAEADTDSYREDVERRLCFTAPADLPLKHCETSYQHRGGRVFATEAEWNAQLRQCCNWLPPPVDVYNLTCGSGPAAVGNCRVEAWSWDPEAPGVILEGNYTVWMIDGTSNRTLATGEIPEQPQVDPLERLSIDFEVGPLAMAPSNNVASINVTVGLWPRGESSRAATATTTTALLT